MRILRILLYVIILAGLMIYGKLYTPTITLNDCVSDPAKFDGAYLEIANEITVQSTSDSGFTIHQDGKFVEVKGAAPGININDYIALKAIFHKDGWLELVDYHVAEKRRAKIWVSVFPVLLIVILFFKTYRFNWRSVYFSERN